MRENISNQNDTINTIAIKLKDLKVFLNGPEETTDELVNTMEVKCLNDEIRENSYKLDFILKTIEEIEYIIKGE